MIEMISRPTAARVMRLFMAFSFAAFVENDHQLVVPSESQIGAG
jgi:hypothetical protein